MDKAHIENKVIVKYLAGNSVLSHRIIGGYSLTNRAHTTTDRNFSCPFRRLGPGAIAVRNATYHIKQTTLTGQFSSVPRV